MKISAPLGLKSLISKIHPPLPLNPRESQKLLHLIQASFRQQLDQEHQSSKETEATNKHISSFLASPLFKQRPIGSASHGAKSLGPHTQEVAVDSLAYFEQEVHEGAATLETARNCLRIHLDSLYALPSDQVKHALKESRAADKILHWLWSSGLEQSTVFMRDVNLHKLLVPLLVLQSKEAVIWRWLRTQHLIGGQAGDGQALNKRHLLLQFVSSTIHYGGGLNDAMAVFMAAINIYGTSGYRRFIFDLAGSKLAGSIRKASASHGPTIDTGLFNSFLESLNLWASHPLYFYALLSMYHPLRPDASAALAYLRTLDSKTINGLSQGGKVNILRLCFVTAKHLLASSESGEAHWVSDFVQDNFAEIIGAKAMGLSTANKGSKFTVEGLNVLLLDKLIPS
ncbi:MAG: hypothetical protein MMC33_009426 [Icmadophila ericetorum]|nr:hypothetical protein [Icmadophila ericetorum]